jgi:hypothetical protein
MPATQASELLEQFAAGAAPQDVCTPQGRALLRGAVRAYSAEMARAGLAWPAVPVGGDPDAVKSVDANVLIAFTAGFVERSDFVGPARQLIGQFTFEQWPELPDMRRAARVACEEVAALQQAAARFVLETERYRGVAQRAEKGESAAPQLQRQARRLERAESAMQTAAYAVETRVDAERRS